MSGQPHLHPGQREDPQHTEGSSSCDEGAPESDCEHLLALGETNRPLQIGKHMRRQSAAYIFQSMTGLD